MARHVPCPMRMRGSIHRGFPRRQTREKRECIYKCAAMRREAWERGGLGSTRQTASESSLGPKEAEAKAEGNGLPMAAKILGARRAEMRVLRNTGKGEKRG